MLDIFPSREAGRFGRRLKRARGARVPVTIVTGFLGAGKTTLVRRFLSTPEGHGTAVVINALGGEFHLELLLAMIDAVAGLDTLAWSAEARKQVILADRLVVSKADLVSSH